jgi:hypothetical protein
MYVYDYVSTFWKGNASSNLNPSLSKNQESPILELFKKQIPQNSLETVSPRSLQWMKQVLVKLDVDNQSSYFNAIDTTLLKTQKNAGPMLTQICKPVTIFPLLPLGRSSLLSPLKEVSTVQFLQPASMSIEETKQALSQLVPPPEEIDLHDVDDELLLLIAEKFPQLKVLRLQKEYLGGHYLGPWDLTDRGLLAIEKLTSLEKLELSGWEFIVYISSNGLKSLFSTSHLANQLTELKLVTFQALDENLLPLSKYKKLETLSIRSAFVTPDGLKNVLQSPSLKNSLSNLYLYNSTGFDTSISDNVLKELNNYSHLEHLVLIASPWKSTSQALQQLLASQSALKTLVLNGTTIDDGSAEKIGKMTKLEHLELLDCSAMTSDTGIPQVLNSKENLRHLNLQEIVQLNDQHLALIGQLQALEFLSLSSPAPYLMTSEGLKQFCECEAVQNNLQTFRLKDFSTVKSEGFGYLGQLKKLSNLRLDSCLWFNDDSLRALANSPLRNSLQEFEFNETVLSDQAIFTLTQFEKLKNLTLASCYGLTNDGKGKFLEQVFFKKNLFGLCMDSFDLSDEVIKKFSAFESLKVLIMSNNGAISNTGEKYLLDLAKEKGCLTCIASGETDFFNMFESSLKAGEELPFKT